MLVSIALFGGWFLAEFKKQPIIKSVFTDQPSPTPKVSPTIKPSVYPLLDIPFTAQAPFGNWADERQEDGCEEASVLMAMRWIEDKNLTSSEAEREIIAISDFQQKTYGDFHDTSSQDTALRIVKGYFGYSKFEVKQNVTAEDIKKELLNGNAVITPMNGQKLKNPYYKQPGPIKHMLIVKGYDPKKKEFITNDPGTKRGKSYHYKEDVFMEALQDYQTGFHLQTTENKKTMIVIRPNN